MLNKRGVDAVIATVLILMITVSAVAIIWATVIPMIKDSLTDSTSQQVSLTIETADGYTVYDPVTNYSYVQVKRGTDDSNLTGLKITFFNGKESKSVTVSEVPASNTLPTNNGKVYAFYLGSFGQPVKVSVSPIFTVGKKAKEGKIMSEVSNINTQGVSISRDQALAQGVVNNVQSGKLIQSEGLVGYWPLDETSGTTAVDYSGNGFNGICTNMGASCNSTTGKIGTAFKFDGVNDWVNISTSIFSANISVSMVAWVYLDANSKGTVVWIRNSASGLGTTMNVGTNLDGGTNLEKYSGNLSALFESNAWIDSGKKIGYGWHFIGLTINSTGSPEFWIDGSSVSKIFNTPSLVTSGNGQYLLGGNSGRPFNGTIDEVAIWNRTLTAIEISQLYNGGNGRSLK